MFSFRLLCHLKRFYWVFFVDFCEHEQLFLYLSNCFHTTLYIIFFRYCRHNSNCVWLVVAYSRCFVYVSNRYLAIPSNIWKGRMDGSLVKTLFVSYRHISIHQMFNFKPLKFQIVSWTPHFYIFRQKKRSTPKI